METKQFNLFAIVVTYNGVRWLDACLGSLKNSTRPVQILVVDNASSDDTVSLIRKNYPEVLLIENTENQGFGKANNQGIRKALEEGADYIYLLNQDAWLEADTLAGLVRLMESEPEYGIISPMQYAGNGKNLDKNFQQLLTPDNCPNLLNDLITNDLKSEVYPAEFVMAAHWLVRPAALKDTGYFLPLFRHYGEDKNLIHRMAFHGWETGIAPRFKAFHDRENRKESAKQKLHIQYARYLAQSVNINKPAIFMLKYFGQFLIFTIRSKAPVSQRISYLGKACLQIGRILYYRRRTKNSTIHP